MSPPPPPTMSPPPPPPTMSPQPATLPDELLEDIFLRLPPDEPAWLVRSSLASKLWLGLLTGARFRGRYREFHGAPPMLGFFHSCPSKSSPPIVPTAKFGAGFLDIEGWIGWHNDYDVWDCRHGCVLLCSKGMSPLLLVVWDPMTGRRRELRVPRIYQANGAAVLCTVTGCDHGALCHDGPFRVAFVGLDHRDDGCVAYGYVSLPEVCEWSKPCSALHLAMKDAYFLEMPPVSIQDAVYFLLTYGYDADNADNIFILKYDLGSHCLSLIDARLPVEINPTDDTTLMAMEDGGLGFAHSDGFTLYLWSRRMCSDGVQGWTQRRVMDLKNLLPIQNRKKRVRLIGSMEGRDIIFVSIDLGIYEISLKSLQLKNIGKIEEFCALIPYRSFYNKPERSTPCDAGH